MPQDPGDQLRFVDARDDPQLAPALGTRLDVDKVN
jgi:hypothetical protein